MRELILMRHAEAVAYRSGGADAARPLTARGREAAGAAARMLAQRHGLPQRVVYSPAQRTTETAQAVAAALRVPHAALAADARIYLATCQSLLAVIAEAPDHVEKLLVVAHNPAVSELAATLQAGHVRPLATAEFRHFELPIGSWQELPARA